MRRGTKQSLQARATISAKMKGKPKSPEQREKMANARTAWWAKKKKDARNRERLVQELSAPLMVEHDEPQSETITHRPPEFR